MDTSMQMKRRTFLRGTLATGAVVAAASAGLLKPGRVFAADQWPAAAFNADKLDAAIQAAIGVNPSQIQQGKVQIKAPTIAENGAVVPVTVSMDSPMTDNDYVKDIYLFSEGNPAPLVAIYHLTPMSGKAEVSSRIKMGKTSKVRAIAKTSGGQLYQAANEVKVTIGGCGG